MSKIPHHISVYRPSRYLKSGLRLVTLIALSLVGSLHVEADIGPVINEATEKMISEGYYQLENGDADSALSLFQNALKDNSDNLAALLGTAMIYAERADHTKAFDSYDSIVKQYPQHAFAWNGRGLAAYNLEDFDTALSSFQNAVADKPVNGFFYESIAWTRLCRGEFAEAADSAKIATLMYSRKGEQSVYPLLIAYFAYLENGQIKDANQTLAYAVRNVSAFEWPAPVINYLTEKIDSSELIASVMNTAEETEAHVYIGLLLKHKGQTGEAKKHLDWVSQHGDERVFEYTLARAINLRGSIAAVIE